MTLLGTGDKEIVENAPFDYYWGCGKSGTGQNQLGKTLMQVRDQLRNGLTSVEDDREFKAGKTEPFTIQMGQKDHLTSKDAKDMKLDANLLKIACKEYYP